MAPAPPPTATQIPTLIVSMLWLVLFAGGAIGAVTRFFVSGVIYARVGTAFPWGTLAVNLIGSFCMGIAIPLIAAAGSAQLAAFVITGVIGAFTTFSTFSLESIILIQQGQGSRALLYVFASVLLGLLSLGAGLFVANSI